MWGKNMNYFVPKTEFNAALIPITEGCSWNRCDFCEMYKGLEHREFSEAEIAKFIKRERRRVPDARALFIESGDPLEAPVPLIERAIELSRAAFPDIGRVSMYASALNISRKSDAELSQLRAAGVERLYVGIETRSEAAWEAMNKGLDFDEVGAQLDRLSRAGIDHAQLYMSCVADPAEDGAAIADFINRTRPVLIVLQPIVRGLHVPEARDIYTEELALLENLAVAVDYELTDLERSVIHGPDDVQADIERIREKLRELGL